MSNQTQLAMIKKDTVDIVAAKVKEFQERGEIHFPSNYSPENAMKSAWLKLQEITAKSGNDYVPALQHCTKDSIANSLLDMVVQGLTPAKNQGYFIAYGKQLTFQRSYFGTMQVTKRVTGAKDIVAMVIYEDDDFEYEIRRGKKFITKHRQSLTNVDNKKIIGAYGTLIFDDENRDFTEIMTMEEIQKAWSQSKMKSNATHEKFTQEMAKKTVINRTCKTFLNSSDDSSLVMKHFNQSDEVAAEAQLEEEIQQNANSEIIDVEFEVKEESIESSPIHQDAQTNQDQMQFEQTGTSGPGW